MGKLRDQRRLAAKNDVSLAVLRTPLNGVLVFAVRLNCSEQHFDSALAHGTQGLADGS